MEIEQRSSVNENSDEEIVKENEEIKEKKRKRNREYQRAWRQRNKDLKKKDSKEEKEEKKRKRHRDNQRAYYQRTKGLKENDKHVEELSQKKLDDLQIKRKKLDSNDDHKNVVQCRTSQNLENVQLEQNQFLTQQFRIIYEESHECLTPKVIPHRNTDIPGENEDDDDWAINRMTSSDTYQLKWHSHSAHLNGSVAALLRSERFTDVVLCTMDGSQIPAHKFILSSCSVYLSSLFDGQRSVMRMGGMLYVVLPSEISTKALKILVEYMYKGETTVSNEVLDTVLKAGEVLKIRGLWRQLEEAGGDSIPAEKTMPANTQAIVNKQSIVKKPEEVQSKITMKKDDKVIKFNPVQTQGGVTRPMFIGPPKLVFIKTTEGGTQAALRPGTPLGTKGQTILVAPTPVTTQASQAQATVTAATPSNTVSVATATVADDTPDDAPPPRFLRRHAVERKYGKKQKTDTSVEGTSKDKNKEDKQNNDAGKSSPSTEIMIKDEPEWDASSIEEEERSIAEMFQQEMNVKSEPIDEIDIDEEGLVYSPLACELCAEVFTVPAAWVRHVQSHARASTHHARKRKLRSASDDTEETMALLRCDLCQKHFPNPAEWVRHIQSAHTETEGVQSKVCTHCKKMFPSHASMLIHMRTHTGERPFVCGLCNKGFNVKSNLLRHLRTLHDELISAAEVDEEEEPALDPAPAHTPPGPSELKRET